MVLTVEITAGTSPRNTRVSVSGRIKRNITKDDRKAFGLSDRNLQKSVRCFQGNYDVYFCEPTPGGLYTKHNCKPACTVLEPVSWKVARVKSTPVLVSTNNFVNNSKNKDYEFSGEVVTSTQKTVTHSWKNEDQVGVGGAVNYDIKFPVAANINYTHSWGKSGTQTETEVMTSQSSVKTSVGPQSSTTVDFEVTRHTVVVEVEYKATLTGYAMFYKPGSMFSEDDCIGVQMNAVLANAGLDSVVEVTETIKINHFDETTTRVNDD